MWSNVISPLATGGCSSEMEGSVSSGAPPTRYKHGTSVHYDAYDGQYYVYVYGGRSGTFALKDFWQLNLATGIWRELTPPKDNGNASSSDSWPPRLQEHTLVSGNNRLYMFGGECHHNSDSSSHVWVWGRENLEHKFLGETGLGWSVISFKNTANSGDGRSNGGGNAQYAPLMRRGHSAVVADVDGDTSMIVFGGYRDLKGSLADCWAFSLSSHTWQGMSLPPPVQQGAKQTSFWTNILNYWTAASTYTTLPTHQNGYYSGGGGRPPPGGGLGDPGPIPPARHNHSAVVYNSKMYVYGGMCDLTELSDFWVFDLESRRWAQIKCLYSPGVLKGHAAVVVGSHMYFFGGEGKAQGRSDDVWRFDFASETFERLQFPGCRPCPRVFATASKLPRRRSTSTTPTDSKPLLLPNFCTPSSTTTTTNPVFRKSTSVVRFADTQHLVTYSDSATCSDYSSMETINYVENPNYRHRSEAFELRQIGNGSGGVATQTSIIPSQQHPEYVLLIGGLETHKSAVFTKKDLVVWRLRVDCHCSNTDSVVLHNSGSSPNVGEHDSFEHEF